MMIDETLPRPMVEQELLADRLHGALLGLAVGDALGTTVEFKSRGTFTPVVDMVGGGPFQLPAGAWTDDTSMALCLAVSLIKKHGFDERDQMERYCLWHEQGYMSSTGDCFDIGTTVYSALQRFKATAEPYSGATDERSAGNGCLMRLAPIPMFYRHDRAQAIRFSGDSARTTHGAQECIDACRLFGAMLHDAISGLGKEQILFGQFDHEVASQRIIDIFAGRYREKSVEEIRGSGYVVESLEAALWCFYHTDNYRDAVLMAVNLGDDADTTAAICGQIAGAFYGECAIPSEWMENLFMASQIREIADQLSGCGVDGKLSTEKLVVGTISH